MALWFRSRTYNFAGRWSKKFCQHKQYIHGRGGVCKLYEIKSISSLYCKGMKCKESVRYFRNSTDVGLSYQNQKYDLLHLFASAQIRWFVNITTDSWGGGRWEKFNCCHPYIMTAVNNYIFIGSFRSIIIAYFWLESCAWNVIDVKWN